MVQVGDSAAPVGSKIEYGITMLTPPVTAAKITHAFASEPTHRQQMVTLSMADTIVGEAVQYNPLAKIVRRYLAKRIISLLLCFVVGVFFLWYVWPGVTSQPSLDIEYLTMVAAVLIGFGALTFLIVIVWNERLARIEDGRLIWPFPFRKKVGGRTRYVLLEEIVEAELTINSSAHRGAELTLRDGTRLFLPQTVFGVEQSNLIEVLTRNVKKRSVKDPRETSEGH